MACHPRVWLTSDALACLLMALLAGGVAPSARAQETRIEVSVSPRKVPANGQVRVEILVSGPAAGNAVLDPPPQGKKLIQGGGINTSSSFQFVNGAMSSSKTFTLTYLPSGTGIAEVPPFVVKVDGTTHKTAPVTVTITEASESPTPPAAPGADKQELQVQVLAEVDRARIFRGESITLQYRLLFRDRVSGLLSPRMLEPMPNFVVEDVEVERQVRRTEHEGLPWQEVVLFQRRLVPAKTGRITVPPVLFRFEVDDPRARTSFLAFGRTIAVERTARALPIEVLPLPDQGRPADFSGAVGKFTLNATLDRTELSAGDAAALKVTVEGDGPLDSATPPQVPEIADLRIFDPEVQDGRRGRRVWTYPLVPQSAGEIVLPPIRWSYFDPKAASYRTLETRPLSMKVAPGQGAAVVPRIASGRKIQPLAADLRFIKPAPARLLDRSGDVFRQGWFWMLVGLPWVSIPAVVLAGWYRDRLDRTGLARERSAARQARKRLGEARASLETGNGVAAQRLAAGALAGYIADRTHRSPLGMTYDELVGWAVRGGASDVTARSLRGLMEGLDDLRYSRSEAKGDETRRLIEQGEQTIAHLEREWR